ncbi:SusC/RagA family TonB-linked outer membrane protein [Flammeovirga kamogawensis]|uniref:TonB-dependent receptor n=1 Tax=Flammeovirga kamogawensis TaxID=373891 RepID=A0ABX8H2P2_9BACT|nr:TonB-dependent receptor [Flammeovirga kamogawensis]MBB6460371.1 TonB-linked SusC/RagA family outer membrane protein [Flammeovirga kamogawensis]QWG10179.1 TonB-dependent receptor [Flammeovirga kamogawensis]TRX64631.1 TonB-dependent receptor [Flammeovirga kamogawensis]
MNKAYVFFKIILTLTLFSIMSIDGYAQNVLKGQVVDASTGEPLPGVNIFIEKTTKGTITNFDGEFSLVVEPGESIVASFIGYVQQVIPVTTEALISISLQMDTEALEEVVVIGYGTQKKKEITGAVGVLKSDAILKVPTSDLGESLQGQIAGVDVQASSGRPGSESNIQIRGVVSATSAGAPLYIVDGIPFQGNPNIAPEQIESIDVLKDGAAASIYGTRAAGGVILITTKRGKEGSLNVDFSGYAGVQNITSGTPVMNTTEQLYVEKTRLNAVGQEPITFLFNPDALYNNSDFVGDVQNNNAAIQSYNLGISGGTKELKFNVSTNYFNQDGVMINSGFERFTTRVNGEFKKNKFRAFASLGITDETTMQEPWALYELAIVQRPWDPALSDAESVGDNGIFVESQNAQQYGYLARQLNNTDQRDVLSTNMALTLEYEFVKGLKYQINLGRNTWEYERNYFRPQFLVYNENGLVPAGSNVDAMLNEDYLSNSGVTLENILKYDHSFGKHNIGLTAVYSWEEYNYKQMGVGVVGLLSNSTPVLGAGTTSTKPYGSQNTQSLVGKMFRAQYNYDNKYLASFSVRNDGSSNFSEENRYGTFFGGSVGWNISEENFFKNSTSLSFVNNLKIRASYGEVGNQNIDPYMYIPVIESGVDYPFGPEGSEELGVGAIQRQYANQGIKWETTISKNIGIDLSMFNDRLQFTADVYRNNKEDMLLNQRLAPSSGTWATRAVSFYNNIVVNAGDMYNQGLELSLSYKQAYENGFQWSVTGTYAQNQNKVTDLNGLEGFALSGGVPITSRGERTDPTTFLIKGYEAGAFFLLENQGVIKTSEQLEAYKELNGSALIGDMMYKDQNGDGVIDDNDRVYAGSGQAKFNMGMGINASYKGFDFYMQLYYSHGSKIYNGSELYAYSNSRHKDQLYMWTPQNADSNIPTARGNQEHENTRARSDYFLEDGTYLRIRNMTLGYTIPNQIFNNKINSLRFYFTAQNPFTFTKYKGYDPEVGGDGLYMRGVDAGNYPVSRRFLGGVKLNF